MKNIIVSKPGLKVDENAYITKRQADAYDYIKSTLLEDPETNVEIHGGDGSVFEAVNAIMDAGANDKCALTIVPSGTGNDFAKSFNDNEYHTIDVIKVSDKYCANMVNIGFDCDVVIATEKIKNKKAIGNFSYILGVIATVFKKFGKDFNIEITNIDGTVQKISGTYLLLFAANGQYCGGGFKAAPLAQTNDGLIDLMLFNNVSRLTLAKLIGRYKSGTHVGQDGKLIPSFQKYATYLKCLSVKVSGPDNICIDGEIFPLDTAEISVIPSCLKVRIKR